MKSAIPPAPGRARRWLLAALLLAPCAVAGGERTTLDGVYTSAQAAEGQAVHRQHCARCHDPSEYQGRFLDAWQHVPLAALYDVIELKMPEDDPGSLPPEAYAAVLAYILELNGLPPGRQALGHRRSDLAPIVIVASGAD